MMAQLTPPRAKFGHPSGQVWPKDLSWPITTQSSFCKDQGHLTLHMNDPNWWVTRKTGNYLLTGKRR